MYTQNYKAKVDLVFKLELLKVKQEFSDKLSILHVKSAKSSSFKPCEREVIDFLNCHVVLSWSRDQRFIWL